MTASFSMTHQDGSTIEDGLHRTVSLPLCFASLSAILLYCSGELNEDEFFKMGQVWGLPIRKGGADVPRRYGVMGQ